MKKLLLVLISGLAVVFMGAPAVAQQEEGQYPSDESWGSYQYVQGTITDVSPAHDQIRVEGGDGSLTDFAVPPGSVASPEDLAVGEEVTVGYYPPAVNLLIYPPQRTADQITILA
jgi:hypothetical protein